MTRRRERSLVFAASAIVAIVWVFALEWVVTAAWLSPVGWALALAPAALLVLGALLPAATPRARVRGIAVAGLLLSVFVVLVPWNDRKRFVQALFSVRVGMSVADVDAVMDGYLEGPGPKWQLAPASDRHALVAGGPIDETTPRAQFTGTKTYRWSERAEYDSDWGQVGFVDGKVASIAFLPD